MKKRLFFFCAVAMVVGIIIGSYAKEFTPLFLVPLALLPFFVFKRLFKFALVTLLLVISLTNSACAYKEFHNELPDAFVVGIVSDASGGENKSFVLSDTNVVLDGSTLDIDRVLVYFSGEELPSCGQWVKIRSAASHHVDKIRGRHAPEPLYKLPRRSRKIPDNFTANRHLSSPPFLFLQIFLYFYYSAATRFAQTQARA